MTILHDGSPFPIDTTHSCTRRENEPVLSVVVPVFNEELGLVAFYEAVSAELEKLGQPWEIVFVNDGSSDNSWTVLCQLHERDSRVKVVGFARNFGNQIALSAGLEHARGEAMVIMDADLQHPPKLIHEMFRLWKEEHYESVYTVRTYNEKTTPFKCLTSRWFHKTLNFCSDLNLPEGISDFRLLDRKIVDYLSGMQENPRFLRALISWLGFRQKGISYTTNERFAGESKFSFSKLLKLSLEGLTAFSTKPLRWIMYFGMFVAMLGVCYAGYVLFETLCLGGTAPGWPTLVIAVLILGGLQLCSLGVIGEYVGKIYMETKRRPLFVIQEKIGFGDSVREKVREDVRSEAIHLYPDKPTHSTVKSA